MATFGLLAFEAFSPETIIAPFCTSTVKLSFCMPGISRANDDLCVVLEDVAGSIAHVVRG